jgi:hypothetical protein
MRKPLAAFSLLSITLLPPPAYLQQTKHFQATLYLHSQYTMPPSTPSASDTGSALQALTAATAELEGAKRSVRIYDKVSQYFKVRSYSDENTEIITEMGQSVMDRLKKNVVERQTLLTAASEAYRSSLSPTEQLSTHTSGQGPDDTAKVGPELKVVTPEETVRILQTFEEVQAKSTRDSSKLDGMYLKVEKVLSTGKFKA